MPSSDQTNLVLKGVAISSTLWVASTMASTSLVFIPSLLRPLTHKPFGRSGPQDVIATPAPSRPTSSLQIPTLNTTTSNTDGRLTPQPRDTPNPFTAPAVTAAIDDDDDISLLGTGRAHTYQTAARQFTRLEALLRQHLVPVELVAISACAALAYRTSRTLPAWTALDVLRTRWAWSAGLLATIFPIREALMAPLTHKLRRLGGEEEMVEPYEDAPPDRAAERGNAVAFVQRWSALNAARCACVLAAAAVGLRAGLME